MRRQIIHHLGDGRRPPVIGFHWITHHRGLYLCVGTTHPEPRHAETVAQHESQEDTQHTDDGGVGHQGKELLEIACRKHEESLALALLVHPRHDGADQDERRHCKDGSTYLSVMLQHGERRVKTTHSKQYHFSHKHTHYGACHSIEHTTLIDTQHPTEHLSESIETKRIHILTN